MTAFTKGNVAKILISFGLFLLMFIYFYGPPLVPALRNSAIERCTVDQGGDYRSYRLEWISWGFTSPELTPHWKCVNKDHPYDSAIDYGWYAGLKF
jgi:hypothetical protein